MENISIKGHVQIFDENNNLVTEEDNMVVASGRVAVRSAFLSNKTYSFSKILLGSNEDVTTPEMVLSDITPIATFDNSSISISSTPTSINDPIILEISFGAATYEQYVNIKELCLVITDGTTESLFSRVVFSGYPFTKDHTYTMKYSVYF